MPATPSAPETRGMRFALISDIHASLPALEAVLTDIGQQPDVGATYHLGDLVGDAPWPNETVEMLQGLGIAGVAGNHDSTVATDYKHCGCRYEGPRQHAVLDGRSSGRVLPSDGAPRRCHVG